MSTFETEAALYTTTARNALARIEVFLRAGAAPPRETVIGAFEDPATVLAALEKTDKGTLAALIAALDEGWAAAALEERVRDRILAGDRRTIEAIELFARRHERHHDYVRTLAEIVRTVGDPRARSDFSRAWSKALATPEARSGLDFRAKFAAVVKHAIEYELAGRKTGAA